jgi:hypothetical protein
MKNLVQRLAGRMTLSFLTSRLAKAGVGAALALIAASGAKADFVETFNLNGYLNTAFSSFSPLVPFTGTIAADFSDTFAFEGVQSLQINVYGDGEPVFNQGGSLVLTASTGVIEVSNSSGEWLTLMFTTPHAGTWDDFNEGAITSGQLFGEASGFLFGADGVLTRVAGPQILTPSPSLDPPPITDPPPVIDPPPLTDPPPLSDPPVPITSAAVPELSTWVMMLVGLIGLGLVAKRRRAFSVRSERG